MSQISFEIGLVLSFNRHIWSKLLESYWIVSTKLIISCLDYIKKVNSYQKWIKIDQNWLKLIKFNWLFDINQLFQCFYRQFQAFNQLFRSFNQFISIFILKRDHKWSTLIKNISKLWSSIQSDHWNPNRTKIDDQIRPAWNPNCWRFDLEA